MGSPMPDTYSMIYTPNESSDAGIQSLMDPFEIPFGNWWLPLWNYKKNAPVDSSGFFLGI